MYWVDLYTLFLCVYEKNLRMITNQTLQIMKNYFGGFNL